MKYRTLDEAFEKVFGKQAQATQPLSMDEAFDRVFGQQAQNPNLLSMDEAFEKVYGKKAVEAPVRGHGVEGLAEKYAGLAPAPGRTMARPVMTPENAAALQEALRSENTPDPAVMPEETSLSSRAVDYGRRALGGIDAGLANVAASMAHGGGWMWGEYSDLVNSGVNAVSRALTGRELVPEGPDAISQAALATGDWLAQKGQEYSRFGLGDREPELYDAIMQGLGSTAAFMLPGAAVARGAGLGRFGSALAYGATKGGLESVSEGGSVYRDLLKQGASLEEARSAARKDAIAQFPINVASDAVGDLMGGGGWLRGALGRGAGELVQETGQSVLSDTLSKRKADGKPVTWGDLARAVPEMAKAVPEAMWNEGVPAFISAALIGAGEGVYGKAMQRREAAQQHAESQVETEVPARSSSEIMPQEGPIQVKSAVETEGRTVQRLAPGADIRNLADHVKADTPEGKAALRLYNDIKRQELEAGRTEIEAQRTAAENVLARVSEERGAANQIVAPETDGDGQASKIEPADPDVNLLPEQPHVPVKKGRYTDMDTFLDAATSPEGKKMSGSMWIDMSDVSDETAQRILDSTGVDVHGYSHALDGSAANHILNRHGENGTALKDFPGQIPLTREDFRMLPEILENPDSIEIADKGSSNNERLLYKKRINGHSIVIEEIRGQLGKLIPVTMWKEKSGAVSPTSETSPTPSGPVSATPLSEQNVSPQGRDVNAGIDDDVQALKVQRPDIATETVVNPDTGETETWRFRDSDSGHQAIVEKDQTVPNKYWVTLLGDYDKSRQSPTSVSTAKEAARLAQQSLDFAERHNFPENKTLDGRYRAMQELEKSREWSPSDSDRFYDLWEHLHDENPATWGLSPEETKRMQDLQREARMIEDEPDSWPADIRSEGLRLQKILWGDIDGEVYGLTEEQAESRFNKLARDIRKQSFMARKQLDAAYARAENRFEQMQQANEGDDIQPLRAGKQLTPEQRQAQEAERRQKREQKHREQREELRSFEAERPARLSGDEISDNPVSTRDIIRAVRELVPVRHGLGGKQMSGVLGYFKKGSEVTRTKYRGDIPVLMHELGHFLDKKLRLGGTIGDRTALQELASAGGVTSGEGYTPEQIRAEGIAQFVQFYASNEQQALREFPEFTQRFEAALDRSDIRDKFLNIKNLVSTYLQQSPEEMLSSNIVSARDRLKRPLGEKVRRVGERLYEDVVDSNYPLAKVSKQVKDQLGVEYLPDELNLLAQAQTAPGYRGKADRAKSEFLNLIREAGVEAGDLGATNRYMAAMRAQDYRAHRMEPGLGVSAEGERRAIAGTPQRIKDLVNRLYEFQDRVMRDTLVKSGVVSKEAYEAMREKWPHYVKFRRVGDGGEDISIRRMGRGFVDLGNPIKKATGVADAAEVNPILSPLESIMDDIGRYYEIAAKQEVAKTLRNISELEGMGWIAEKLDGPTPKSDDSTFYIWNDGKKEYYATDPDVYRALKGLDSPKIPDAGIARWAHNLASGATEALKLGATRFNPAFTYRNPIRDSGDVAVNSAGWTAPLVGHAKGITKMLGGKEGGKYEALMQEVMDEGVFQSGMTEVIKNSSEGHAKAIEKAFRERNGFEKGMDLLKTQVADRLGNINEKLEVSPKVNEYDLLTKKGVPKKEAARLAREVNLDFSRAGRIGRIFNRYIPFLNASIQGTDKIARTFIRNPGKASMKAAMFVTVPEILFWALAHMGDEKEREEYKEIERWKKDLNWHVRVMGKWLAIPKPPGVGQIFGSPVGRLLDKMYDKNPVAMEGLGGSILEAYSPNHWPALYLPIIESMANKSFFNDRPIVPRSKEKLPAELQYGPGTSWIARKTGELTGFSPYRIDHAIRGYTGTTGSDLSRLPDIGIEMVEQKMPAKDWTEWPVARSFFTDPYRNSESVDRFYRLAEQTEIAKNGYEVRQKSGQSTKADKDVRLAGMYAKARTQMSGYNRQRAQVQQSKALPPEIKRREMDRLDRKMMELARKANSLYDEAK